MSIDKNKTKSSLTGQLVDLIHNREIINEDLQVCSYFVLDAMVNAIAGKKTHMGKVMLDWWTTAPAKDAGKQAFLAGALIHTLEMDDLHKKSVTHPGCVVVPAALAVAARDGLNGKQLLIAILRGYEAMCRIGNAIGRTHYKVWHSTATCGPYGSAMAAGSLLGITRKQQVWAMGNAGAQSAGLWEFMNSGGMSKHLHAGRAAESGILAADLARFGFTGPDSILEGKQGMFVATSTDANPAEIMNLPDDPWQLTQTSIKPWPCCRHTHPAIDAALELSSQIRLPVSQVTVSIYQAALDVCDRPNPETEYAAKFSLQHCVAVALDKGVVGFESFTRAAREESIKTRHAVRIELSAEKDAAYPENWGCDLSVTTEDGQCLHTTRIHCKGDPELPLMEAEMIAKAKTLLDHGGIEEARQQQLINFILDLENQPHVPGINEILYFRF